MKQNVEANRRGKDERKKDKDDDTVRKPSDNQRRQKGDRYSAQVDHEIVAHRETCIGVTLGPVGELWQLFKDMQGIGDREQPHGVAESQRSDAIDNSIKIH